MARPKIEEIEKLKRAAIELPADEFESFYEWIMLLAEVREAEAKRTKGGFKSVGAGGEIVGGTGK